MGSGKRDTRRIEDDERHEKGRRRRNRMRTRTRKRGRGAYRDARNKLQERGPEDGER